MDKPVPSCMVHAFLQGESNSWPTCERFWNFFSLIKKKSQTFFLFLMSHENSMPVTAWP